MHQMTDFFKNSIGISPENQTKILYSIVILVVLGTIRFAILRIVWKFTEDPKSRYTWRRSVSFTVGFLTVILIGSVWIKAIGEFGTFLGLLTAGLAIALKDMLTNIAGWIFILARKPFSLGDRVQIGEHAGDVIDLRLFQFTLLEIGNWVDADQSTGRIIHIPNGTVFTRTQANYSAGFRFIWNEMPILVTFESNWRMANIAQTINVLQALIFTKEDQMLLTPTYHIYDMYKVHHDAELLPLSLEGPDYTFGKESLPAINASASKSPDGKIHVSLVNIDPEQILDVVLKLRGTDVHKVNGTVLTSEEANSHNTFANPGEVVPVEFKDVKIMKDQIVVTLPAKSVVVLEIM